MKYHIKHQGVIVASFLVKGTRDRVLKTENERFPYAELSAWDDV